MAVQWFTPPELPRHPRPSFRWRGVILPAACGNVSRCLKLLHDISIIWPPNTIHAGLVHFIPGRLDCIRRSSWRANFLPIAHAMFPTHQSTRKMQKVWASLLCVIHGLHKGRYVWRQRLRNTTGKSVNPTALRLMVVWRTVDYQQWKMYPVSSKICSVFQRHQVCHKTVKINTKVNRIRTSGSVHVTKQQGFSLHPGFAFDVLWSDYYNHSVVRLEFRMTSPLSSSDKWVFLCVSGE
jgi:hypothetical protein